MYKSSYELIDIKERKEGRLELLLFLLLDESFPLRHIKNRDCRKTWGRLGFTSSISTSALRTKHSLFCARKRNNHNINDSGSLLSYFVSPSFEYVVFIVDIIDTPSPRPLLGIFRGGEKKV